MDNSLTWLFDITVIEWLFILTVVAAVVLFLLVKTFRMPNAQSGRPVSSSESWHSESEKAVFESLQTTVDGLSKEEINNRLVKYGPNRIAQDRSTSA